MFHCLCLFLGVVLEVGLNTLSEQDLKLALAITSLVFTGQRLPCHRQVTEISTPTIQKVSWLPQLSCSLAYCCMATASVVSLPLLLTQQRLSKQHNHAHYMSYISCYLFCKQTDSKPLHFGFYISTWVFENGRAQIMPVGRQYKSIRLHSRSFPSSSLLVLSFPFSSHFQPPFVLKPRNSRFFVSSIQSAQIFIEHLR